MKKITILTVLAGFISVQAFSQTATQAQQETLSRSGVVTKAAQQAPMSLLNPASNYISDNGELLKNGGLPAVSVAYSDDFSAPSDTNGLKARGYLPYYRGGGPMGTAAAWFQGNAVNWPDYNNGSAEYVSSNYNSVTGTNNIDNWLVLPSLDIAAGDVISFYSRSPLNSTFPDSIRVMYSAAGDSVPESLTWVELGRFKVNTTGNWMLETFSAPAPGATARFAIRYCVINGGPTGANSNLIGIDQLDVFTPALLDLQAVSVNPLSAEYTRIPLSQAGAITLNSSVKNNGASTTTGGTAVFEVIDTVTSSVVFTETVNLPSINAGVTIPVVTTNTFTPSAAAFLRTKVTVNITGDGNAANDVAQSLMTAITDSVYARDNDLTSGSLGIGAGPASGIVGQNFLVTNQAELTSVSFFMRDLFTPNPSGTPVYATIHAQTPGSTPNNTVLGTTASVLITPGLIQTGGQWFTVPMTGSPFVLSPGLYYVGVHEVDSLLTLGTTNQIITPNTVWVTWATIPTPPAVNGWATAQAFNFNVTYNLRANFGISTGIQDVESNSSWITVYPSPASSEINVVLNAKISNSRIEIYNALGMLVKSVVEVTGNTKVDVSAFAKGIYTLKVISGNSAYTKRFSVIN